MWINPITDEMVELPSGWATTKDKLKSDILVDTFINEKVGVARLLREETSEAMTVEQYAKALMESKVQAMDKEYQFDEVTNTKLEGTTVFKFSAIPTNSDWSLSFFVWKDRVKDLYWHSIFTISKKDREKKSQHVEKMLLKLIDSTTK